LARLTLESKFNSRSQRNEFEVKPHFRKDQVIKHFRHSDLQNKKVSKNF